MTLAYPYAKCDATGMLLSGGQSPDHGNSRRSDVNSAFKLALIGGVSAAAVAFSGPGAYAANFGPAAGSVEILGTPTVNTVAHSISFSNLSLFWSASSGTLSSVSGVEGTINGTIDFSPTTGGTNTTTVSGLLTVGGYTFDLDTSTTTVSYSYSASSSGSLSLYVLGTMGGNGDTSTATSLTLTANDTSGGPWSSSFSLANPPAPLPPPPSVPEPATLTLLGSALVGLGTLRRRKR